MQYAPRSTKTDQDCLIVNMDEKEVINGPSHDPSAESAFMHRYKFNDLVAAEDPERRKGETKADGSLVSL